MIDLSKSQNDLDLSYLKELSGDSPDFMLEMLDTLELQIPQYMAELRAALDAQNWTAVSNFAHKIKPTFFYVGREDLRDCMQLIERNAKELKEIDTLPNLANEVFDEMKQLFNQVDKAKEQLKQRI
ncbi:Hpt domain-containing protein [Pedobacter montanisoli]|uniref:Hpt domain-containing protein n=1 Tax=Pedobacter montanisoli TaxID=2923277 RepID=A0ABS9ZX86_9SPHI|nr:Hpt domain-containing protein [Pedobacter montanisoli]MCJ0742931.1 Hpt domain-containing protein [Pedobacter montanisoli]